MGKLKMILIFVGIFVAFGVIGIVIAVYTALNSMTYKLIGIQNLNIQTGSNGISTDIKDVKVLAELTIKGLPFTIPVYECIFYIKVSKDAKPFMTIKTADKFKLKNGKTTVALQGSDFVIGNLGTGTTSKIMFDVKVKTLFGSYKFNNFEY
jgi:hypothetical protein